MRLALTAALTAGGMIVSSTAFANGDARCFDKATLQYVDCEQDDWSGVYAGVHAGYAWAEVDGTFDGFDYGALDVEGPLVGAHIGIQKQFDSGLVLGLELDGSLVWADDDASRPGFVRGVDVFIPLTETFEAELNWLASARARIGLALDNIMPFITGGVALGNFGASASTGLAAFDLDETVLGGVFGGGVELKLDTDWTAGLEGLYYVFDEERSLAPPGLAGDRVSFGDVFAVRARLSYSF